MDGYFETRPDGSRLVIKPMRCESCGTADPVEMDAAGRLLCGDCIAGPVSVPIRHHGPRVRRNGPCPCGSGYKWKRCCRLRRA